MENGCLRICIYICFYSDYTYSEMESERERKTEEPVDVHRKVNHYYKSKPPGA